MNYSSLQVREVFHLEFLRELVKAIPTSAFVLKGGSNIRFFFGSVRYSEDMDIDIYNDCLHESFKFIFTAEDQNQYELLSRYLERAEDLEVMERTFSGNSYLRPDGLTQPGLQSITIANWSMVGPSWVLMPAEHADFPNSYRGIFYVWMIYAENGSQHTITLQTTQLFYIKSYEDTHTDGTVHDRWYLVGQEDLAGYKVNEDVSWGAVKALFM